MKIYRILFDTWHGTTLENAMSIVQNGSEEVFFTTSLERAKTYGEVLLRLRKELFFVDKEEFKRFKKTIKNHYLDAIEKIDVNKFCLSLIHKNEMHKEFLFASFFNGYKKEIDA